MFEIEKSFSFEAGHVLRFHDGACSRPHGHSYVLKVAFRKRSLIPDGPQQGMVLDFHRIRAVVKPMIDQYFDHQWLNETLNMHSPTVESIAKWIFDYLSPRLEDLYRVSVCETPTSCASYIREES